MARWVPGPLEITNLPKADLAKGLSYAAPPVGNLRFAAPQDPLTVYGVQAADTVSYEDLGNGVSP